MRMTYRFRPCDFASYSAPSLCSISAATDSPQPQKRVIAVLGVDQLYPLQRALAFDGNTRVSQPRIVDTGDLAVRAETACRSPQRTNQAIGPRAAPGGRRAAPPRGCVARFRLGLCNIKGVWMIHKTSPMNLLFCTEHHIFDIQSIPCLGALGMPVYKGLPASRATFTFLGVIFFSCSRRSCRRGSAPLHERSI